MFLNLKDAAGIGDVHENMNMINIFHIFVYVPNSTSRTLDYKF